MKNEELVKDIHKIDKDFEKRRKDYQKIVATDNSIEKLVEINKQINKIVKENNLKSYDYSKAKKKMVNKGDKNSGN